MLLVGHSHAAIGKAVSHALVHSQCQQELALQLARKEAVALQTKLTEVETEMQAMSLTVAELSKQLETERSDNAEAGRQRLKDQDQINQLTRIKVSLEDRVHELETAAKKEDSDEDWGYSGGGAGLFAMMSHTWDHQPSQQSLLFTEQPKACN